MKKLIFLSLLAIGMTGCSVESMDSEELLTADAKFKIQQVEKSLNLLEAEICEGDAPVFVFNFPQDTKGNGDPKDTNIKIQIETFPGSDDWESFDDLTYAGAGPEEYTYEDEVLEVGTYSFRVSIGSGGFVYTATLDVVECSDCEESFSYTANGGNSYTFSYTSSKDIEDAELVFTLAQSETDTGLEAWEDKGETKQKTMDLEACKEYTWTVTLTANCKGKADENNAWTDFTVNTVSKKGELDNITQSCPE